MACLNSQIEAFVACAVKFSLKSRRNIRIPIFVLEPVRTAQGAPRYQQTSRSPRRPRGVNPTCLARLTAHSENKDEADRSVLRRGVRALRDGGAPRPPAAPTPTVCAISN